ncbi:hypothetical protein O0L34_g2837 [Tuta absoluta]|nr:hypothetical protein O0L34_g2837 [Tuta absoluta]
MSIVLAALLLNLPVLRFAKASQHQCSIDYEYLDDAERFNLVDTIVTLLLPLTVIIIMNTWIMIGVCRLERVRLMLRTAPARPPACPRSQQRVTRMLLLVSSVFVVLNMPAYVVRIIAYAKDISGSGHEDHEQWMSTLQQLSIMFFNTNFGINFILYCLSGQNFRRALRQTMPWLRKRARRGVAVRRPTSCHPARASSVSTSFVSNCTEATQNAVGGQVPVRTPSTRLRRREPCVSRWIFDNSRQRQTPINVHLEMRSFSSTTESNGTNVTRS